MLITTSGSGAGSATAVALKLMVVWVTPLVITKTALYVPSAVGAKSIRAMPLPLYTLWLEIVKAASPSRVAVASVAFSMV